MDLTSLLLRVGARRPHVLVVPPVGGTAVRLAVEAELARRGWPEAVTPADADLLVVAGVARTGTTEVVDRLWRQVPAPRVRVAINAPDNVPTELDAAAAHLADLRHQRSALPDPDGHGREGGHHGGDADGSEAGIDVGGDTDPEHGGHGGHGNEMEMPGGLPMADTGEDRDGLMLDRLHVPLGPVLPDWPAGLVVRAVLQGDVIQEAEVEVLDHVPGGAFWSRPGGPAARELDALARFLGVAGWADAAARARRVRDELLVGATTSDVRVPTAALVGRVRRSRTLRWLIRGIDAGSVDVAARLEQRLAVIESAVLGDGTEMAPRSTVTELAQLLVGAELAAARLVVAVLDPETEPAEMLQASAP